jgi:MscS family membrane protein
MLPFSPKRNRRLLAGIFPTSVRSHAIAICLTFLFSSALSAEALSQNPLMPPDTSSPRSTLNGFISALDQAYGIAQESGPQDDVETQIRHASRYLDQSHLPPQLAEARSIEAALMLKEVLDRIDLPPSTDIPGMEEIRISREASELGHIVLINDDATGDPVPAFPDAVIDRWRIPNTEITIGLVAEGNRKGEYLFTPDTVDRAAHFFEKVRNLPYRENSTQDIYHIYLTTPGHSLNIKWAENFPTWSMRLVGGQTLWQWGAGLLLLATVAWIIRTVLIYGKRRDTPGTRDVPGRFDRVVRRSGSMYAVGISFLLVALSRLVIARLFNFTGMPLAVISDALFLVTIFFLSWLTFLVLGEAAELYIRARRYLPQSAPSQLVRFMNRLIAVIVVIGLVVYAAQRLGLPLYSVMTGLGIGGLAVAFAAQETLKDLFGSLMIMMDRPYRIGDWVVVGNTEGTVEAIGFHSTRIRTFYDSMVTIPNGEIVKKTVDNMGMRTYRRVYTKVDICRETAPEKIEAFLEGIKRIIQTNSATRKDYFHVVLHDFAPSSLQVMLYFFLKVPDWSKELVERQRVFIEIIRLAHALGVAPAPTQVLKVDSAGDPPAAQPGEALSDEELQAELKRIAESFGGGPSARPDGLGIFVPPSEENRLKR